MLIAAKTTEVLACIVLASGALDIASCTSLLASLRMLYSWLSLAILEFSWALVLGFFDVRILRIFRVLLGSCGVS